MGKDKKDDLTNFKMCFFLGARYEEARWIQAHPECYDKEGGNIKMTKLAKEVYLKNGIFGFWRGSIARLLRVAPGQGVMFLTYDFTTQIIDQFLKK